MSKFNLKQIKERAAQGAEKKPPEQKRASTQAAKQAADDPEVNLSVRVPKSHRAWWTGKARMENTTMTDLIKEFLEERYGLPPDQ